MFVPKWIIASIALLIAGFGFLNSQEEPRKKAEEKKNARLDDLRKQKAGLAKEYFSAQFELCRLGLQDVLAVREAALILGRAKYDLAASDDERLAILTEQRQIFNSVIEVVAKRVERGTAAKLDLTQVRMGLLEAEIELELFKESVKEANVPRK